MNVFEGSGLLIRRLATEKSHSVSIGWPAMSKPRARRTGFMTAAFREIDSAGLDAQPDF
jgi:hypothetical protein